jgi:carbamoyltransferase
MAYNILGITPGHNGSVALVSDGELIFFLEEDRFSKIKYEGNPLKTMFYVLQKYKIDELVISGVDEKYIAMVPPPDVWKDVYTSLVHKFYPNVKTTNLINKHHLTHASNTFYNSGFNSSSIIVIDNVGSYLNFSIEGKNFKGHENETIYKASYSKGFEDIYKSFATTYPISYKNKNLVIENSVNITKLYESLTVYLGWSEFEAGKTMGLSSYGKNNPLIPTLFKEGRGDKNLFSLDNDQGKILYNFSKFNLKDLAYKLQTESQELVGDLVQKAIDLTGENNICISGGYGLNCVANYYMKKRFPNVNFYHEPLAHDAGNSIGAALYRWYEHSGDTTIRPRKTLYNGPKYTQKELLEGIKKYVG